MANTLFLLNDAPYGTEHSYNALRLAASLSRREGETLKLFLIGDAVACAKTNQHVPPGYYNIELMLQAVHRHGAQIGICGTCLDARGIAAEELMECAMRGTLEQLTDWTVWADKTLVF